MIDDGEESSTLPVRTERSDFSVVRYSDAVVECDDDEVQEFGVQMASNEVRNRVTNRVVLELVAIMLAFIVPANVIYLFMGAGEMGRWLPFGSLVSALLILGISATSLNAAMSAFCGTRFYYFLEATFAAAIGFVLAHYYTKLFPEEIARGMEDLVGDIGLPMAIFAIGVVPGIFEEIAFRGIVQSRVKVLFGFKTGVLASAMAFALAHGVTLGFPFHVALGLYFAFLKERSGSLIPGMLCHFAYNTSLVVASHTGD